MLSGGSPESTSLICEALIVTVQVWPAVRFEVGSSVCTLVPLPLNVNVRFDGQVIVYADAPAVTASLNVITMFVSCALLVEPFGGVVERTEGAESIVIWEEKSGPGLSGGSLVSSSVTLADVTEIVHVSPAAKSVSGLIVQVMWSLELSTFVCDPDVVQLMPATVIVTASVHVMLRFVFVALLVLVSIGEVETICGFASVVNEKL